MKGNLERYFSWQARDFVRERGIAMLLIGLLFGMTVVVPLKVAANATATQLTDRMATQLLLVVLPQLAYITSFIVLNGIISTDRTRGYYRFLFSKPVSLPAYYAQAFVVYFLGYVAAFTILLALFVVFVSPIMPFGALAFSALVFLSLGGIAFFISSLFRRDWIVLGVVLSGTWIMGSWWGQKGGIRHAFVQLLPPVGRLSDQMESLVNRGTVDATSVLWLLGYSAIFFVAGLVVLHRRPIG
jgi:ABC-type transport system involved in multi-copper enzyme maturation permease subunit